MPLMRGIMAVDAGGNSGVAWGIFPVGVRVSEAFEQRMYDGSRTFEGPETRQVLAIYNLWRDFYRTCVRRQCMPPDAVELVIEDFVLRGGSHGAGKEGNSPIRIGFGLMCYRMGRAHEFENCGYGPAQHPPVIWQTPSEALSFSTNQRLKDWGAWVVGREHERDAWRHIGFRLSILSRHGGS